MVKRLRGKQSDTGMHTQLLRVAKTVSKRLLYKTTFIWRSLARTKHGKVDRESIIAFKFVSVAMFSNRDQTMLLQLSRTSCENFLAILSVVFKILIWKGRSNFHSYGHVFACRKTADQRGRPRLTELASSQLYIQTICSKICSSVDDVLHTYSSSCLEQTY